MFKICYAEEFDKDFIRWTGNLLRRFLADGRAGIVSQKCKPDLMLASIWRKHGFPKGLPVALISNENWQLFPPRHRLSQYRAVIGIYPPPQHLYALECSRPLSFIQYPYEAVHFHLSIDSLLELRETRLQSAKSKFCCFVVSNTVGDLASRRSEVFARINAYQKVDSAGSVLNNTGYLAPRGPDFLDWIAQYKFMICLENSKTSGYITEKALQASLAGTVPIYDGGGVEVFNSGAFVDCSRPDYLSRLAGLDNDTHEYEIMQSQALYSVRPSVQSFEEKFAALFLH